MADDLSAAGAAFNIIGNIAAPYAYIGPTPRFIGTIIADVTIEEIHLDEAMITEHPVESGSPITDHIYLRPQELEVKVGFSNSSAASEGWVQAAYQLFLSLQQSYQPFAVSTGKRFYSSMVIRALRVTTDQYSEYALNLVVSLKQLITASTQTSGLSNTAAQANPQQTSSNIQAGQQQLQQPSGVGTIGPVPSLDTATSQSYNIAPMQFPLTSNDSNSWAASGSQPGF